MKKQKRIALDYAGIQGFYSMIYAGFGTFAAVFLTARGWSNTETGMIIACGNLLTVLFSPLIGDFADRSKKISLTQILLVIAFAVGILSFLLIVLHGGAIAVFVFYVLLFAFHGFLQPLVNALNFRIEEKGIRLNFGVCRSAGSIFYAIMTSIVGALVEDTGIKAIPASSLISTICLILSILLFAKHLGRTSAPAQEKSSETISLSRFIQKNRTFLVLNIGVAILFFHSYVISSFMLKIIEPLGGDAVDMGHLFSISAGVEVPAMMCFGLLNRKFSSTQLLKFSMTGFVLKTVLLFSAQNIPMVCAAQSMQAIGYALFYPAMVRFIGEQMSRGEAVKGQSLFTMMMTISAVSSSILGGFILDRFSVRVLLILCVITALAGASVIVIMVDRVSEKDTVRKEVSVRTRRIQTFTH